MKGRPIPTHPPPTPLLSIVKRFFIPTAPLFFPFASLNHLATTKLYASNKDTLIIPIMIWAVNRYIQMYRLTARPLSSTHLCTVPWIMNQCASHYSIIKIVRQFYNIKSLS